jgi:hypothetical protein
LAEKIPAEDKSSSSIARLRERVKRLIRSASAAYVYSQIQVGKVNEIVQFQDWLILFIGGCCCRFKWIVTVFAFMESRRGHPLSFLGGFVNVRS